MYCVYGGAKLKGALSSFWEEIQIWNFNIYTINEVTIETQKTSMCTWVVITPRLKGAQKTFAGESRPQNFNVYKYQWGKNTNSEEKYLYWEIFYFFFKCLNKLKKLLYFVYMQRTLTPF